MISYEDIRHLQILEKDNQALQPIDENIFKDIKEYILEKKKIIKEGKNKKDNLFSKDLVEKNEKELRNVYKVLEDLCFRRYKKIVNLALNNVSAKVHDTENMLPEEEEFYNFLVERLKKDFSKFISKFEEKEVLKRDKGNLILIRISDDVPAFMWKDGKTYGPYKKEDIVNLEKDLAEILIKEGKAIKIVIGDENKEESK